MSIYLQTFYKTFGVLASSQMLIAGLGFITISVNTRALTAADLGWFFLVQAWCELVAKVISFQNWQAAIRIGSELRGREGLLQLWKFGMILDFAASVSAALIAGVLLFFFSEYLGIDEAAAKFGLVYAACIVLTGTSGGTSEGTMQLLGSLNKIIWINILLGILLLTNAIILYKLRAPLELYLINVPIITAFCSALTIFVSRFGLIRHENLDSTSDFDHDLRKRFLRYAVGTSASATLNVVRQRGELILVGALLGPAAAALFGVAYRVAALLGRFAQSARVAIYPGFSSLVAAGNFDVASRIALSLTKWNLLGSLLLIIIIAMFGGTFLQVMFGQEFRAAFPNLLLLSTGTVGYMCIFAYASLIQISLGSGAFFRLNFFALLGFFTFGTLGPLFFGQPGAGAGAVAFAFILAILVAQKTISHKNGGQ